MGCGTISKSSVTDTLDSTTVIEKHKKIEKLINKERVANRKIIKILLLGGAESGKTTIFKQMRILHLAGFSKTDLANYRSVIRLNCITALQEIRQKATDEHVELETSVQEAIIELLNQAGALSTGDEPEVAIGEEILNIWRDPQMQRIFELHGQSLPEYTKHYLDSTSRIWDSNYCPTEHDILLCRIRTTGITQLDFPHGRLTFKIVDVGGQRTERRKWIHCFDDVQLVMYVAGISDFDRVCDDSDMSRLQENLEIFDSIVNSKPFRHTSVVLFLNKTDVLGEKLQKLNFSQWYPEYQGPNTLSACCEFLEQEFRKRVKSEFQDVFPFRTVATDTKNIDSVFEAAVAHVIDRNLGNIVS